MPKSYDAALLLFGTGCIVFSGLRQLIEEIVRILCAVFSLTNYRRAHFSLFFYLCVVDEHEKQFIHVAPALLFHHIMKKVFVLVLEFYAVFHYFQAVWWLPS